MIVIPMAGMSSRFFRAGYTLPKYMLEAHGKTIFEHSLDSFSHYFSSDKFLFIIKDVYGTHDFLVEKIKKMGIKDYSIYILENETRGQAETVFLGLKYLEKSCEINPDSPVTIFNIDTFRPGFKYPDIALESDGYLEVFEGSGDNWSFVKPLSGKNFSVEMTAEKNPISNLCCTGLYHFSMIKTFFDAFNHYLKKPESSWEGGELYIAPLYNYAINSGSMITYNVIERSEVIFCGVPEEYIEFSK